MSSKDNGEERVMQNKTQSVKNNDSNGEGWHYLAVNKYLRTLECLIEGEGEV